MSGARPSIVSNAWSRAPYSACVRNIFSLGVVGSHGALDLKRGLPSTPWDIAAKHVSTIAHT